MHDLRDAALVDAVFGPCPGKVLHAPDLDRRDATDRHPPYAMAMGVTRRVADDRLPPRRHVVECIAGVGVDAEVVVAAALVAGIVAGVVRG